jgi:hypothetical protein
VVESLTRGIACSGVYVERAPSDRHVLLTCSEMVGECLGIGVMSATCGVTPKYAPTGARGSEFPWFADATPRSDQVWYRDLGTSAVES